MVHYSEEISCRFEVDSMKNFPRTTKLKNRDNTIYKYYPGFSEDFVEDIIKILKVNANGIILDPWNGSGTTTYVASKLGIPSIGLDINPVMSIIASARLFNIETNPYNANYLLKSSDKFRTNVEENDALCNWFHKDTVKIIRNIERTIFNGKYLREVIVNNDYSNLQAFYCLILFNVLKHLAHDLKSSNPTWIKKPILTERKSFSKAEIDEIYLNEYNRLVQVYEHNNVHQKVKPKIIIGRSESIPLDNSSVETIITSPPYCTRIDYAIMTSLELAIFNISEIDFVKLRHSLIGAPVIHKQTPKAIREWGPTCLETLSKIENHHSKASRTYYLKTYLQYFHSIFLSLKEIDRVMKNEGKCIIVIQNSYYKDIFIDLKQIFIEMIKYLGWRLVGTYEFINPNNLAEINPRGKEYRESSITKEYAVIFRKW